MKTDLIYQRTDADCGVACLAMALGIGYDDIIREMGTTCQKIGVTAHETILLLMRWGWRPVYLITYEAISGQDEHAGQRLTMTHSQASLLICTKNIPAVLTVQCPDGGLHAVYFDGWRILCPRRGVMGPADYFEQYVILEAVLCR